MSRVLRLQLKAIRASYHWICSTPVKSISVPSCMMIVPEASSVRSNQPSVGLVSELSTEPLSSESVQSLP